MKYRAYIKKAREDLIEKYGVTWYQGYILDNGHEANKNDRGYVLDGGHLRVALPSETPQYDYERIKKFRFITNSKIPVKHEKKYQLKELGYSTYTYYISEYDSNNNYLGSSAITKAVSSSNYFKYYSPSSENVASVRLQVARIDSSSAQNEKARDSGNNWYSRVRTFIFLESSEPTLIHDSGSPDKSDHLLDPTLELSGSSSGSFSFVINKGHSYYNNKINLWTDTIYITRTYKDGSERIIWDGRPIDFDIEDGTYYYHCEGSLGYLNDVRTENTVGYDPKTTVSDFIQDYIIDYKNDSIYYDKMDRTFFSYKDNNGKLQTLSEIDIDPGIKNLWSLRYESGLRWINDILEGYNSNAKILYRSYDSPNDEIICRRLVAVPGFDKKNKLPTLYDISVIKKAPYLKNGELCYETRRSNGKWYVNVYKATTDINSKFNLYDNIRSGNYSTILISGMELELNYSYEEYIEYDERIKEEYNLNNKLIAINSKDASGKWALTLYQGSNYGRFSRVHTTFGIDIFTAKQHSEIGDIATKIIPRGMECSQSLLQSSEQTDSSYIYLNTEQAFVDGNYSYNGVQGLRHFDTHYQFYSLEDPTLIKMYGLVEAVVDFESADTPYNLYISALDWFKTIKKDIVQKTIEISLSDIGQIEIPEGIEENMLYTDPEYIDIWTQIYAKIPELGIGVEDPEEHYYVSAMSIPLDDHYNSRITLANNAKKLSSTYISAGDIKGASKGVIDKSS